MTVTQPPPPGVPTSEPAATQLAAPGPHQGYYSHQQRFHPYQRFQGPRKPFDYNRIGGLYTYDAVKMQGIKIFFSEDFVMPF